MRIAILIYGYFHVDNHVELWRAPQSKKQLKRFDFVNDSLTYFRENIYIPLKRKYDCVDLYMITHEFNHPQYNYLKQKLINSCEDFKIYFTNKEESPKITHTYANLIKHVMYHSSYDRYIFIRNDLKYKQPITNWLPNYYRRNYCWFLFRETQHWWNIDKRISDVMFVIDGDINKFNFCINKYIDIFSGKNDVHSIYHILNDEYQGNINSIIEGYYNSNTSTKSIESCNPIYVMVNRAYHFDKNNNFINETKNEIKQTQENKPIIKFIKSNNTSNTKIFLEKQRKKMLKK